MKHTVRENFVKPKKSETAVSVSLTQEVREFYF